MQKKNLYFGLFILIWIALPFSSMSQDLPPTMELGVRWEEYKLPSAGRNGANVIGVHQGIVFATNAEANGNDLTLYFKDITAPGQWQKASISVDDLYGKMSPASTTEGILFFGKADKENAYDRVGLLYWDPVTRLPEWRKLKKLPVSLTQPAATIHKGKLTVCGRESSDGNTLQFYQLSLDGEAANWATLSELASAEELPDPDIFIQSDGENDAVYLFAALPNRTSVGYFLDKPKAEWKRIEVPDYVTISNGGITLGHAHILLLGENHSAAYHTVTGTWVEVTDVPSTGDLRQSASDATGLYLWEPDASAGRVYVGRHVIQSSGLETLDYIVLALYFGGMLAIGYGLSRGLKDTNDYFRGGKRIPWWAAGLSLLVTKLSAITFMSLPVKAYTTNWLYFWIPVGNILLAVIVIKYILPFFCRLDITSTYEYLERRFDAATRFIGASTYVLFELVRMGVLLLLPAIVIAVVTDINIYVCIIIIGTVATLYTMLGGIEAVIWTDVVQAIILVLGVIVALIVVGVQVEPGSVSAFFHSPEGQAKMRYTDFSLDLTQATMLVIALSWIGKLQDYVSNQTVVQRFLSTKNEKQAARSMWVSSFLGIPIIALFLLLGTALFLFYQAHPGNLDPFMERPDALLPTFIIKEMPVGLSGLVLAAIFAAAMSSLDSSINSMSTVIVTDFYKRFGDNVTDAKSLKLAQGSTLILGLFGTGSAMLMAGSTISSLYDQLFSIIGLFGGGLAGVFVLGIFTRRANSIGTLTGFFASAVVLYLVSNYTQLHVFLYAIIGMGSCAIIGYLASLLVPAEQGPAALTIYGLTKKRQRNEFEKESIS